MRFVRQALAAGAVGLAAAGAQAQGTQVNTGAGGGSYVSGAGATVTGGQIGTGGLSSSSGGATGGLNTTQLSQPAFQTGSVLDQSLGNQITASSAIQPSNILGKYYASPQYQGRAGAQSGENPGGFGVPLYGTTGGISGVGGTGGFGTTNTVATGSASRTGSSTVSRTGTTGLTGTGGFGTSTGFGGTGGLGGTGGRSSGASMFGGTGGTTNFGTGAGGNSTGLPGGQVIPLPRQIAYTAVVRIPAPAMTPTRLATDVRAVIDRSSMITSARSVEVLADGPVVVLRGAARDEDEARLIEGIVRLTPGVRDVRNEIRFAVAADRP